MCEENDDGEYCTIWDDTYQAARKEHTCSDCGRAIQAGERYTYGNYLHREWGYMPTKMCVQCLAAGRWLDKVCGGHLLAEPVLQIHRARGVPCQRHRAHSAACSAGSSTTWLDANQVQTFASWFATHP